MASHRSAEVRDTMTPSEVSDQDSDDSLEGGSTPRKRRRREDKFCYHCNSFVPKSTFYRHRLESIATKPKNNEFISTDREVDNDFSSDSTSSDCGIVESIASAEVCVASDEHETDSKILLVLFSYMRLD